MSSLFSNIACLDRSHAGKFHGQSRLLPSVEAQKCSYLKLTSKRKSHLSSLTTRALDLDKLVSGPNKEKVDEVIKVADEKLKIVADVVKRKSEIIQDALARHAAVTAEQVLQQSEITVKQLRKESQRAKVNLLVKAEEVAIQAAEIAKDELERASESAPEPIKELAETAIVAHSEEKAKSGAVIHDFCFGIPFGALLSAGGLLWFVLTGSLHALRFGFLLGGLLLGISVRSLQMWQAGKSTTRYIIAQSAIAFAISIREFARYFQTYRIFPTLTTATASAAMFIFFWYVIGAGGPPQKKNSSAVA